MEAKDDSGAKSEGQRAPTDGADAPCSCGPDCCGSGRESGGAGRGMLNVKSMIFIAVVCAAIAVAVWALIRADGRGPVSAGGIKAEAVGHEGGTGATSSCSVSVTEIAPGKDFVFVLLSGANPNQEASAAQTVEKAASTLREKGIRVAVVTLAPGDPIFQKLAGGIAPEDLPAVVLLGGSCGPRAITDGITVDALLGCYTLAACAPGCGPGACGADAAKSGCCPGQ